MQKLSVQKSWLKTFYEKLSDHIFHPCRLYFVVTWTSLFLKICLDLDSSNLPFNSRVAPDSDSLRWYYTVITRACIYTFRLCIVCLIRASTQSREIPIIDYIGHTKVPMMGLRGCLSWSSTCCANTRDRVYNLHSPAKAGWMWRITYNPNDQDDLVSKTCQADEVRVQQQTLPHNRKWNMMKTPDISFWPPHTGSHIGPYICEHTHTHTQVHHKHTHAKWLTEMVEHKQGMKDSEEWGLWVNLFFSLILSFWSIWVVYSA